MTTRNPGLARRSLLKLAAAFGAATSANVDARAQNQARPPIPSDTDVVTMTDITVSAGQTLTVERRGPIVLIGLNRATVHNRIDPDTYVRLSQAYYQYDHDPSLLAAVLFGHGPHFSRGIDVDAFQPLVASGRAELDGPRMLNPLAKTQQARLTKPLIVVAHGDTWNIGHELCLAADIRVAAADTNFGQDENNDGRFPGGGATIRFVREAGWGNAMRYMLTGDHWSAAEAMRMGVLQEIAPTPEAALAAGISIAAKIAACAPLSIKMTLDSAHQALDAGEPEALADLSARNSVLYKTQDFIEGRKAEAEGRAPLYQGQ